MTKYPTKVQRDRFLARIRKSPDADGCWEWLGARYLNSYFKYGRACINRKATTAHRVSWQLFVGPIPKGILVLHRCDNVLCVKPGHLFLGTHDDNMKDMVRKGRANSGNDHWTRKFPERAALVARQIKHRSAKGEKNPNAKLRWEDVETIRRSEMSGAAIARAMGVGKSTVSAIRRHKTWA